ncbi:hypothetical protein V8J88_13870 [Massilia sp. W12]|uniref:hypothetical protein n=1 Tax=Massilia sp. W12 TaxID=3126507 RepID=UPI0030D305B8
MKNIPRSKIISAIFSLCAMSAGIAHADNGLAKHDNPLIYSHQEMFQFDIAGWLQNNAPHLKQHAEVISHWAGYTSVSPRVLIALMEHQTGMVSRQAGFAANSEQPFAALSNEKGFAQQVRDVADQIAQQLYAPLAHPGAAEFQQSGTSVLQKMLAKGRSLKAENAEQDFAATYSRLFGQPFDAQAANKSLADVHGQSLAPRAGPAVGFLQFPFPIGQTWYVGGAHTNTGSGNYPMSSLDMSQGGGWGSNQSNIWVTSSAGGQYKRHSSCFAEIVHSGGWSTTYYHLMNQQYNTGANINKNVRFANPANTKGQALCNGGHSTGPHQHYSLKYNGAYYHLNGVNISGWQISATGSSYDTNCSRFYLVRNGVKRCAGSFTNN